MVTLSSVYKMLVNSLYLKLFIFDRVGQLKHTNDILLLINADTKSSPVNLKVSGEIRSYSRLREIRAIPRVSLILHAKHVVQGKKT